MYDMHARYARVWYGMYVSYVCMYYDAWYVCMTCMYCMSGMHVYGMHAYGMHACMTSYVCKTFMRHACKTCMYGMYGLCSCMQVYV